MVSEVVTPSTLYMHWSAAKISTLNKVAHASSRMAELFVVTDRELKSPHLSASYQFLGLLRIESKWLFNVYVAILLQTLAGNRQMTLGWCRYVDHIGPNLIDHLGHVAKGSPEAES